MGSQQTVVVQERLHPPEYLQARIVENLSEGRLKLSHKPNVWEICRYLRQTYDRWEITELHLANDMVAGEVVEQITKINFQKAAKPLRVLALSKSTCNEVKTTSSAIIQNIFEAPTSTPSLCSTQDNNKIASDGCFYLSKTNLQKLQTLDLSSNLINEKGAAHLANCNLPKLLNLNVSQNQISYSGLIYFTKAHWPSLAFLQAKKNSFQPTKQMQSLQFRTQMKMFRLQLQ